MQTLTTCKMFLHSHHSIDKHKQSFVLIKFRRFWRLKMQFRSASLGLARCAMQRTSPIAAVRPTIRKACMVVHAQAPSVAPPATNGSTQSQPPAGKETISSAELTSLKVMPKTSSASLEKVLLSNKTLAASAHDPNLKLRVTCNSPAALFPALMAIANLNVQLAGQGDAYRLQVQSSIRRQIDVTTASTLDGEFIAFLFVNKVLASSLPAVSEATTYAEIGAATEFRKAAAYIQANSNEDTFPVLRMRVNKQTLPIAYKALMLARFSIYKAAKGKAMQDSSAGDQQQQGSTATPATNNTAAALRVQDIAFVPMIRSVQVPSSDGSTSNTYQRLHLQLVRCDPPSPSASSALRLATPKPSRAASESTEERKPRRAPRTPPPRQAAQELEQPQNVDDTTNSVVTQQQWDDVQKQMRELQQLVAQLSAQKQAAADQQNQ